MVSFSSPVSGKAVKALKGKALGDTGEGGGWRPEKERISRSIGDPRSRVHRGNNSG